MQTCLKCSSDRVANVDAKSSDMNTIYVSNNWTGELEPGYVPDDMGIGSGDYLSFSYCLQCGQIQGNFPLPKTKLEGGEDEPEWELSETYADEIFNCGLCYASIEPSMNLVVASRGDGTEIYYCSYECAAKEGYE
jgi:hypothetical protein